MLYNQRKHSYRQMEKRELSKMVLNAVEDARGLKKSIEEHKKIKNPPLHLKRQIKSAETALHIADTLKTFYKQGNPLNTSAYTPYSKQIQNALKQNEMQGIGQYHEKQKQYELF